MLESVRRNIVVNSILFLHQFDFITVSIGWSSVRQFPVLVKAGTTMNNFKAVFLWTHEILMITAFSVLAIGNLPLQCLRVRRNLFVYVVIALWVIIILIVSLTKTIKWSACLPSFIGYMVVRVGVLFSENHQLCSRVLILLGFLTIFANFGWSLQRFLQAISKMAVNNEGIK